MGRKKWENKKVEWPEEEERERIYRMIEGGRSRSDEGKGGGEGGRTGD